MSSTTSKITTHHSTLINRFLAIPLRPSFAFFFHFKNHHSSLDTDQSIPRLPHSPFLRLVLPLQKSPIINRHSSIHSSPSPFALPPPSSYHFKNHQSSLDTHQSIPRLPHSPFLRLLLPLQKSPIITRHSSIFSSRSPFALPPPSSTTSKITTHHSPIINQTGLVIGDW